MQRVNYRLPKGAEQAPVARVATRNALEAYEPVPDEWKKNPALAAFLITEFLRFTLPQNDLQTRL